MTTVGYGDIVPVTNAEIEFSTFAMVLCCGIFAYTIGSIGSFITEKNYAANTFREMAVALSAYMKANHLPMDLRYRSRRFLDFILQDDIKAMVPERILLENLSEPLRDEIFVFTRGQLFNACKVFSNF